MEKILTFVSLANVLFVFQMAASLLIGSLGVLAIYAYLRDQTTVSYQPNSPSRTRRKKKKSLALEFTEHVIKRIARGR